MARVRRDVIQEYGRRGWGGGLGAVGAGREAGRGPHGDGGDAARAAAQQRVDDLHDVGLQRVLARLRLHRALRLRLRLAHAAGRGLAARTGRQFERYYLLLRRLHLVSESFLFLVVKLFFFKYYIKMSIYYKYFGGSEFRSIEVFFLINEG